MDANGATYDAKAVRSVSSAQQTLTLGEERFYHSVWHATEADGVVAENADSKTFSLGYDRLSHLVRLDEKSVRQLIPKLVDKRVLEVLAPEHSATRTGRTYRIFALGAIVQRQRDAGLTHIAKRGRAVEFVHPGGTPTVGVSPSTIRETTC